MSGFAGQAGKAVRWSAISQSGLRIGQLATTAVLARLLAPGEFGLIAMATVIVEFSLIFRDLGTSAAIIQREDINQGLLSTVFWANLALGLVVILGIIALSPLIAMFYGEPRLTQILPVLSIAFIFASGSVLQQALLERRLAFDSLAKAEVFAFAFGASTAITLGILGFGVWSLVAQTLVTQASLCVFLWWASQWRPSFQFRWSDILEIRKYSLNLAGSQFLTFVQRNADYVLIGRFLGADALGIYTIAYRLMMYPVQSISFVVSRALFPVYARIQDDNKRFSAAYARTVGAIATLTFPVMIGVMVLSTPFVLTLLGERWLPVGGLLFILAPVGIIQSIGGTVALIYRAKGRTDWMFRWTMFSTSIYLIAFWFGVQRSLSAVALFYLIANLALVYPHYKWAFGLISMRWKDFGRALATPLVSAFLMGAVVIGILHYFDDVLGPRAQLLLGVVIGGGVYGTSFLALNFKQARNLWMTALRRPARTIH
jgi:O-antigen/teichoic acid export membrane protein